jgi:hypothetical protein
MAVVAFAGYVVLRRRTPPEPAPPDGTTSDRATVERPGIRGRVFPPSIYDPVAIDVTATPADGGATRTAVALASDGFAFAWTDLPPGRYVVRASVRKGTEPLPAVSWIAGVGQPVPPRMVVVGTGMTVVNLEPEAEAGGTAVVVRVVDERARPLEPTAFTWSIESNRSSRRGDALSWRRPDGSFVVVLDRTAEPDEGEIVGRRRVGVAAKGHGRRVVTLPELPCAAIEVVMAPPAQAEVVVSGRAATRGAVEIHARVEHVGERDFWQDHDAHERAEFGGRDAVRLGPVAPGRYDLFVEAGERVLERRRVTFASGPNRVEIPLERWSNSLTLDAGVERKFLFAYVREASGPDDAAPVSAQTDADGRVVFEWLASGDYDVELDGATKRVFVRGDARLVW